MMKQKDNNRLIRLAVRSALLLPFVLVGCSDEMHVFRPNDGSDGLRLELQASIDQQNDTRADESGFADGDTRVVLDGDADGFSVRIVNPLRMESHSSESVSDGVGIRSIRMRAALIDASLRVEQKDGCFILEIINNRS